MFVHLEMFDRVIESDKTPQILTKTWRILVSDVRIIRPNIDDERKADVFLLSTGDWKTFYHTPLEIETRVREILDSMNRNE